MPLSTGVDEGPHDRTVVVHAFHGDVGLVEVRSGGATRHAAGSGLSTLRVPNTWSCKINGAVMELLELVAPGMNSGSFSTS